jgi:hypothetical protein
VAAPGAVNACSVSFANAYEATPVVVASPVGADPSVVTGFVVRASTSGLTINFRVSKVGSVVFDYIVEG